MTISTKASKGDSGRNAGAQGRDGGAKPVSGVVRTLYKLWKYGTIIGVVLGIVVVGVAVLGEFGEEVGQGRRLAALYKGSSEFSQATEGIGKLLNSKKSSFISNKVVNLYLSEKFNKNDNPSDLDNQFADLEHFAQYFLSQRYDGQNFVKFPLAMYEKNFIQVVEEPMTSKALRKLKSKVQEFMENHDLTSNDDVKELKWSRVKKLVDGGKFGQIFQLLKDNVINWVWQWMSQPAKVTILLVDQSTINKSTPLIIQKNKKLLKKWIQQNEDSSEIIILSKYSLNHVYNDDKEDTFKSYQVETGLDKFDRNSFCKYFSKEEELNEAQCNLMRSNFGSFSQLYRFVQNSDNNGQEKDSEILLKSSQNDEQLQKVLQKVCEKGHVKYYFYQNQQNANKILQRNKKSKKSRLDRQMDALLVKFSQLKHYLGINRIKDIYNTLTARSSEQNSDKLTLSQVNAVGLLYDFEHHELRWKNEYQRIGYEMRVERSCKGQRFVDDEIREEEEQEKDKEEKEEKIKEKEDEEEEQVNEDEEEEVEEEYEESPIDYRHSGDEGDQSEGEQEQQAVELQDDTEEQTEQTEVSEQTTTDEEEQQQEQAMEQGTDKEQQLEQEGVEGSQENTDTQQENEQEEENVQTQEEDQQGTEEENQEEVGQQTVDEEQDKEGRETTEQQQQHTGEEQQNTQGEVQDEETTNQEEEQQQNNQERQDVDNSAVQSEESAQQQEEEAEAQQQQQGIEQEEQETNQETNQQPTQQTAHQQEQQSQTQDQSTQKQTTQTQSTANQQSQNQQPPNDNQQQQLDQQSQQNNNQQAQTQQSIDQQTNQEQDKASELTETQTANDDNDDKQGNDSSEQTQNNQQQGQAVDTQ